MDIITTIDFYYSLFPLISLCVEMSGGISGRYRDMTKKEALDFLAGYENEEVAAINFSTYYRLGGEATRKMENPALYIMYK